MRFCKLGSIATAFLTVRLFAFRLSSSKVPIIFICRNNGWAISTPATDQYRGARSSKTAHAAVGPWHGMAGQGGAWRRMECHYMTWRGMAVHGMASSDWEL